MGIRTLKINPILLLWAISVALTPVYVFSEGLPQPSDYVMMVVATLIFAKILFRGRLRADLKAQPVTRALGAFFFYAIIVNLIWAIYLGSSDMLKASLNSFYLFLLFATFVQLYHEYGRRVLVLTVHAMAVAILYEAAYCWFAGADLTSMIGSRPKGSFNNPNQLGYFAVLGASIIYYGSFLLPKGTKYGVYQVVLYGATVYITLASLSRAAALGMAVFGVLLLLKRSIAVAVLATILILFASYSGIYEEVQGSRLTRVDEQDIEATRGYDRLYLYPQHLVLGSGEGEYKRFPSGVGSHEIHSTPGTLLFSYGIIGTFFFALFLWRIYRLNGLMLTLFLLPAFTYGLTHNGLRTRPFWLMLALLLCLGLEQYKARRKSNVQQAPLKQPHQQGTVVPA